LSMGTQPAYRENLSGNLPLDHSGIHETILLADDDEIIRDVSHQILQMCGYNVLEAADGVEALSIFRENQDCISLLLTDMSMPKMSGRELARQVCSIRPDAKVLYMSGYLDDAVIRQGSAGDRTYFLQKPFSIEDLSKMVRDILAS